MTIGKRRTVMYEIEADDVTIGALIDVLQKIVNDEHFMDEYSVHPFDIMQLEELLKRLGEAWDRELPPGREDHSHWFFGKKA